MIKKINVKLSTKEIRLLLLLLLKSNLRSMRVKNLKKRFKNILKEITGNWWTL